MGDRLEHAADRRTHRHSAIRAAPDRHSSTHHPSTLPRRVPTPDAPRSTTRMIDRRPSRRARVDVTDVRDRSSRCHARAASTSPSGAGGTQCPGVRDGRRRHRPRSQPMKGIRIDLGKRIAPGPGRLRPGATSTMQHTPSAWPPPAGSSPPPGSPASPSVAVSATSPVPTASPSTTCGRPTSYSPTASFVTANEDEHADLFWALRGGGGNFGVVTELEFDLHPVDTIYGGPMFFELDVAEALLETYREWIASAPPRDGRVPRVPDRPTAAVHPRGPGRRAVRAAGLVLQRQRRGRRVLLEELRAVGTPVAEHVGRMPYPALNSAFDGLLPPGLQHYWKAAFLPELTDGAIAAHVEHGPNVPADGVHHAPLPDRRRRPRRRAGRDRVRPPGRELRAGDRRHVARPGRQRGQHQVGA